ncbi:hypothetical protein [Brucella inopinata]|uniref:hypothetical protein n=1 Tax=Brucella inopinata TaxID=1218315 RepID=UPI0008711820|nr:hypothetical protein [Brucella inopinata]SCD25480.1 hypothetical protein BR141012304_21021 [Brucella inopinata]
MENDFEYDVAFSFNQQDEALALKLNDLLSDRMKTFIYTERQKEIAGRDGVQAFSDVYGKKARIVVVFYRKEWGETKWTTVEMNSIRTRAFDIGYDFTLFIPTEDEPVMPTWVPKTRLYFGLKRFGLEGAAGAIEQLVTEAGGRPHEESLEEYAARASRASKFKQDQKRFQNSDYGVKAATEAYAAFGTALSQKALAIAPHGLNITVRQNQTFWISSLYPIHMICNWSCYYANVMEGVTLNATWHLGFPDGIPGYWGSPEHKKLQTQDFIYELVRPDTSAYISKSEPSREFTPDALADYLLKILIETHGRNKDRN